jgi:hypothetical protein
MPRFVSVGNEIFSQLRSLIHKRRALLFSCTCDAAVCIQQCYVVLSYFIQEFCRCHQLSPWSSPWTPYTPSANQIFRLLWNPVVHYRVHGKQPLVPDESIPQLCALLLCPVSHAWVPLRHVFRLRFCTYFLFLILLIQLHTGQRCLLEAGMSGCLPCQICDDILLQRDR